MTRKLALPAVALAVDLVVLTVSAGELCVVLIRRGIEPHRGKWALPGGFVLEGEGLEEAAARELLEETGIVPSEAGHLEQLRTFGDPDRDPRGRVVSVAYVAFVPDVPSPKAGGDAHSASLEPVKDFLGTRGRRGKLAFDHATILAAGVERARAKLEYTTLGAAFCHEPFTIAELRRVYEAVWGEPLEPGNFHRKVTKTPGFLTETSQTTTRDGGRPARLYVKGDGAVLVPPLLRSPA